MKKVIFIMFLGFCNNFTIAQERNNFLFFINKLGFAEYEVENQYKINALNYTVFLGKEFSFSSRFAFLLGAELGNYYYNVNQAGSDVRGNAMFVGVPVDLRIYTSKNEDSSFYSNIGLDNKFKINEKLENYIENTSDKGDKGYNLGFHAGFGYKSKISSKIDSYVGLEFNGDILQVGYDNDTKLNSQINLILGFEIFK